MEFVAAKYQPGDAIYRLLLVISCAKPGSRQGFTRVISIIRPWSSAIALYCLMKLREVSSWIGRVKRWLLTVVAATMILLDGSCLLLDQTCVHQFCLFSQVPVYGKMSKDFGRRYLRSSFVNWSSRDFGTVSKMGLEGMLPSSPCHFIPSVI